MFIDISPLRKNRNYRLLFIGQFVTQFGSMITYVSLPYLIFKLTNSSLAVGAIGITQLVPLLVAALVGGAYADALDRRKLLIYSEWGLALCSLLLALNSLLAKPLLLPIYILAALMSALNGFHRPALEALNPRLVTREEIAVIAPINSLRSTIANIAGPAAGGIIIASFGISAAFFIDVLTFLCSIVALSLMSPVAVSVKREPASLSGIVEGLRYARSREELMGTYIVDFIAMVFGMPSALFPAIAQNFGGPIVLGWFYSAMSGGAFLATLTSRWTKRVRRHGAAIIIAAAVWGVAIIGFGLSKKLWISLLLIGFAGAADMVSGIFRSIIWNQKIPDHMRGRLAGVEMISYMSGPLIGNAEAGMVAAATSLSFSVVSGGVLCILGVGLCVKVFPKFWSYRGEVKNE